MKELKGLQDSVKEIEKLFTDYEDMLLLIEMSAGEDEEQEAAEEIEEELGTFEEVFEKLRISTLLIGPCLLYTSWLLMGDFQGHIRKKPELQDTRWFIIRMDYFW